MKQLNQYEVEQHSKILGWLYIVSNALFLAIGMFIFVLLPGIGIASGEPEAVAILSVVGTSVGLLLAVMGLPGMLAGYGLLQGKEWGRILALVIGVIGMVNVPVGTIIGLYTLWVLTQESAIEFFNTPASYGST